MKKEIPENHQAVMPYLIVDNATAFLEFVQQVFNARETHKQMRTEDKVRHAEVMIGNSTIMVADATAEFHPKVAGMFVYVDDADKAYELALQKGASSIMPPADQPYGRSCGVEDAFGNVWWITSL